MARAIDVANFIVTEGIDKGLTINNLKLQKLLYYSEVDSLLNRKRKSLFEDDIEKWKLGPVVPSVYHEFKNYGPNPITETVVTLDFDDLDDPWDFDFKEFNPDSLTTDEKNCINRVLDKLGKKNPFYLVDKTHAEDLWGKDKDRIKLGEKHLSYDRKEMIEYFESRAEY